MIMNNNSSGQSKMDEHQELVISDLLEALHMTPEEFKKMFLSILDSLAETKIDTDNVKSSQIGIDIQDG